MSDFTRRQMGGLLGGASALALLGAAAAARAQAPARAKDGVVVIGMPLEPPVLDPNLNAASAVREITYQNIYESLTRIDRKGMIIGGRKLDRVGRRVRFVFKLRAGVKYHDGEPCRRQTSNSLRPVVGAGLTAPGKSRRAIKGVSGRADHRAGDLRTRRLLPLNVGISDAPSCATSAAQRHQTGRHQPSCSGTQEGDRCAGEVADLPGPGAISSTR
jgi:hypothetical protein